MFGTHRDLALDTDPARRFLPWLLAMIVFLAGIALAGMMSLAAAVERWDSGLQGTVTVQVPAPARGESAAVVQKRIDTVLDRLRATPGVASARALDLDETIKLLEPWLGSGEILRDLPLPRLIDVRVRAEAGPDMAGLAGVLAEAAPGTTVDDHRRSLGHLVALARAVELVALVIVALVAVAAVATVIFITRTGLAMHAETIELLHLIGAVDSYVARQFQGQALGVALKGGIIGLALTAATVALIQHFARTLGGGLLPSLDLSPAQWAALGAVPLAFALIAVVTARVTVMRALRQLP